MHVLVLDDDTSRQQALTGNNPGHSITAVGSATEAIRLLRNSHYEMVFLDHDLDDHLPQGTPSKGTGLHVVRWITNCDFEHRPSLIVVHSTNALGAGDMMRELTEAGFACIYLTEAWTRAGLIDCLKALLSSDHCADA